ncbi:MAG: 50S ribosomal protein L3 [Planctomycetota bacterium]|nr:50S ribosomal protein L3 [Planctomycetota bacterium]
MNTNPGLLGKKLGMTQIYDESGRALPVTAIEAGPCTVMQVKTKERDGYSAIQIGYQDVPPRNVPDDILKRAQGKYARQQVLYGRATRPAVGHAFKAGESAPKRILRELRLAEGQESDYEPGQTLDLSVFEQGDYVDVAGTSKGRGFTGVIKRHGFAMFPKTHGTHEWTRHGGSIGCRKPMHVRKGQRMAGQHGNKRITVQNLFVAALLPEQNVILVRGAIPGPNGGFVMLRKAIKRKKKADG